MWNLNKAFAAIQDDLLRLLTAGDLQDEYWKHGWESFPHTLEALTAFEVPIFKNLSRRRLERMQTGH